MLPSTKDNIEEAYQHLKSYLNNEDCCDELHDMCMCCEKFCGTKEHDYSECRELSCFQNYLGFFYLNWSNGYK